MRDESVRALTKCWAVRVVSCDRAKDGWPSLSVYDQALFAASIPTTGDTRSGFNPHLGSDPFDLAGTIRVRGRFIQLPW